MPTEPLPWDRRDFRKHDGPGSEPRLGGGGFGSRWREQQHLPNARPPYYQQQELRRCSDIRSPRLLSPGHGKEGGWHLYSGDAGQGFMPFGSRYADRNSEYESRQPSWTRGNGGYFRNNRGNRVSFTPKVWKPPSFEPAKSPRTFTSRLSPNSVTLSDQSQPQPRPLVNEKNNRRGNFFSHSSCSKSVGEGPAKIVSEVQPKNATLVRSLPDDACVRSTSRIQSVETGSRKKPRLGWGQGLAKFEKEVESPEDITPQNELDLSVDYTKPMQFQSVGLPEKGPRVASLSDCASPDIPSSVSCSSSQGVEGRDFVKEANMGLDRTSLSASPDIMPQTHCNALTLNLENLELASIANLSSLIEELVKSNDSTYSETGHVAISMNKLLLWKVDLLKALEITESEIESLETELKSLIAKPRIFYPSDSSFLPEDEQLKQITPSRCCIKPYSVQTDSLDKMVVENEPIWPEDVHVLSKYEGIDSRGSVTSFPSDRAESVEGYKNLDINNSANLSRKCLKNNLGYEVNSGFSRTTTHEDLASISNVHHNYNIHDSIFSSNRDAARRAMDKLNTLLPRHHRFDSSTESLSSLERDSSVVEEKFLRRKRFLQFKEKVLTLKFKVFQHFWKEDRLLSIQKLRGKMQKKFAPSRHGRKKDLSSHSRASSFAGGPQTVRADEVIQYVNGLLSELAFKPYRNTLRMPALILDKEVKMSRFISNNGLMEDPCAVEKERSMINPWTPEEKEIFVDKLAAFGKDFGKIASFLDHKTVSNCIEFYYKNHKSKCFDKTWKNPSCSSKQRKPQSTTYLVASRKRRNLELNAASLDILSAASEIAANIDNGVDVQPKSCIASMSNDDLLQRSDSKNTERETEAADVLASICGSLSSDAVSSCITSSVDHPMKQPLTPEVTQDVDDECSDESWAELNPTDWSDEEKSNFIQAVSIYGKDFLVISECVGTRSVDQCKLFFSKARKCLGLDLTQHGPGSASGDVDGDGGDSDIEDGCTMESGPQCEMEEDLPPPDMKSNHQSDNKDLVGVSDVHCGEQNQLGGPSTPEGNSDGKIVKEKDANSRPSIPIEHKETPNHNALSDVGANRMSVGAHSKLIVSASECERNLPGHSLSDSAVFSQILQGHPVNLNPDWHTDFFLEKCNRSRQQSYVVDTPFPSLEQSRDCSRTQSGDDKPSGYGDVKLFGAILRTVNHGPLNLTLGADQKVNLDVVQSKFNRDSYIGTENNPVTSFGLWDGRRGKMGIPPMPDSARLLAKYPAAFSNYAPKQQPFTMEMKQTQHVRRRNALDLRGLSEINVVENGGVFVGGLCSNLTDPVAAVKMQCEEVSMEGGNVVEEDDRWINSTGGIAR